MKEVTFGLTSLNDHGHGFKINFTFHPTMRGMCDFDITYIFEGEETEENVGVLMEHDDLARLQNILSDAFHESCKRLPEVEDDEYEVDLADFLGDDD